MFNYFGNLRLDPLFYIYIFHNIFNYANKSPHNFTITLNCWIIWIFGEVLLIYEAYSFSSQVTGPRKETYNVFYLTMAIYFRAGTTQKNITWTSYLTRQIYIFQYVLFSVQWALFQFFFCYVYFHNMINDCMFLVFPTVALRIYSIGLLIYCKGKIMKSSMQMLLLKCTDIHH